MREAPANRQPSRHISIEKHAALNQMIDLQVIQPSTAWSQVIWYANQATEGDLLSISVNLINLSQMQVGKYPT